MDGLLPTVARLPVIPATMADDDRGQHFCPCCRYDWRRDSEYGISIELHGACLWCRHKPGGEGTAEEVEAIKAEYARRSRVVLAADLR
jgi:hypothetical protein